MSKTRNRRSRALGVSISALAFGAYLVLATVPAQAAVVCVYDAVNKEANIAVTGNDDSFIGVGTGGTIVTDDDSDLSDAAPCGIATVNNTDGINVDGEGVEDGDDVNIDLRGGPFAPGETPEATGIAEIEFDILGNASGSEEMNVEGTEGDDTIVYGDGGSVTTTASNDGAINLNADSDADVTYTDMGDDFDDDVELDGNSGNDTLSLNGGSGTGGALEHNSADIDGGEGNDTITGTDFDNPPTPAVDSGLGDDLDGGEGNDTLRGGGGDDDLDEEGAIVGDEDGDGIVEGCGEDAERDVLEGGSGEDDLDAGDGRDTLRGGQGIDDVNGEGCNDLLDEEDGPNGADILNGNIAEPGGVTSCDPERDDVLTYAGRNSDVVAVIGGGAVSGEVGEGDTIATGVDSVIGGDGDDTLTGDGDENFLAGGPGDDTITAGAGDDCLQPGGGNDTMDGGLPTGSDMADFSNSPAGVTVDLAAGTATGDGTDTLTGVEDLQGSAFADTLLGDEFENDIFGGDGNDTMDARGDDDGGFDDDVSGVDGQGGDDTITDTGTEASEDDHIGGGSGNDNINAGVGDDDVDGDDDLDTTPDGNDTVEGGEGDDDLDGNGGDDTVTDSGLSTTGDLDNDELDGGDGNDTLTSDQGDDLFRGDEVENEVGDGNDTINSGAGDDTIEGNGGDDTITDTGLDDGLTTSSADDIAPGSGDDVVNAGEGDDCVGFAEFDDGECVDPEEEEGEDLDNAGDDVINGEAGDDELNGGQDDDEIDGGEGDDTIEGDDDTDRLRGGDGEDDVEGGDGADRVDGGNGDDSLDGDGFCFSGFVCFSAPDTVVYSQLVDTNGDGNGVNLDMSLGFAEGDAGNDTVINFEKAIGSKFDDQIKGGETGLGGGFNFILAGGGGDDIVTGSTSNDTLKGAAGDDLLIGLGGADVLKGGNGHDEGNGGNGLDICFSVEVRNSCRLA